MARKKVDTKLPNRSVSGNKTKTCLLVFCCADILVFIQNQNVLNIVEISMFLQKTLIAIKKLKSSCQK